MAVNIFYIILQKKAERLAQVQRGFGDVPEVEHLVKPQTYDLPSHTVTISDVAQVDFIGSSGTMLGTNQVSFINKY